MHLVCCQLLVHVQISISKVHLRLRAPEGVVGITCESATLALPEGRGVQATAGDERSSLKEVSVNGLSMYWLPSRDGQLASESPPTGGAPEGAWSLVMPLTVRASAVIAPYQGHLLSGDSGEVWKLRRLEVQVSEVRVRVCPTLIRALAYVATSRVADESRSPLCPPKSAGIARPTGSYLAGAGTWLRYAGDCVLARVRQQRLALHPQVMTRLAVGALD